MNGLQTVHGSPRPKYGLAVPSLPTQSLDDIVYSFDVASDASGFDFTAFQTQLSSTNPNHKLVNISQYLTNEGKTWVRYTFSKLPGKLLQGSIANATTLGVVGSYTRQQVATGTSAASGFLVVDSTVEPIDAQVSTITTSSVTSWPVLTARDAFTANRILTRHITGTRRTTVIERVAPDAEPKVGFYIVESNVAPDQNNSTRSIRTTVTVDRFIELVSTQRNPRAGGAKTIKTEVIVPTRTTAGIALTVTENVTLDYKVSVRVGSGTPFVVANHHATGSQSPGAVADYIVAGCAQSECPVTATSVYDSGTHVATITFSSVEPGLIGNTISLLVETAASNFSPMSGTFSGGDGYTQPDAFGEFTVDSSVEDIDGTHALKTVEVLASGEEWPTVVSYRIDPVTNGLITEERTKVLEGSVTEGVETVEDGVFDGTEVTKYKGVVTEEEEIPNDKVHAYKVVRTYYQPAAHSKETAIVSVRTQGFQAPSLFDSLSFQGRTGTSTLMAFKTTYSAALVPHTIRTFWIIGQKPELVYDKIVKGSLYFPGASLEITDVLHDGADCTFADGSGSIRVVTPPTTPSYTEYVTELAGTTRTIHGSVNPVHYQFFWECELVDVDLPPFGKSLDLSDSILSPSSAYGTVGDAFSYQITASFSATGYTATDLPGGLNVNTSTGLISGTPLTAQITTGVITATDGTTTVSKNLTITITA